jgi:hypothetical protein
VKRLLIIGAALLASACATPYGEIGGLMDDGVTADRLTSDRYRIRSRLNEWSDPAMVGDYALLRAAETVRASCGTHFIVEGDEDRTEVEENYTPASTTHTREKVKGKDGKVTVVERVEHTDESWSVSIRPGADFYVRALTIAPGARAPEGAIPADEVLAHVGARVKRKKNAPVFIPPVCPGDVLASR